MADHNTTDSYNVLANLDANQSHELQSLHSKIAEKADQRYQEVSQKKFNADQRKDRDVDRRLQKEFTKDFLKQLDQFVNNNKNKDMQEAYREVRDSIDGLFVFQRSEDGGVEASFSEHIDAEQLQRLFELDFSTDEDRVEAQNSVSIFDLYQLALDGKLHFSPQTKEFYNLRNELTSVAQEKTKGMSDKDIQEEIQRREAIYNNTEKIHRDTGKPLPVDIQKEGMITSEMKRLVQEKEGTLPTNASRIANAATGYVDVSSLVEKKDNEEDIDESNEENMDGYRYSDKESLKRLIKAWRDKDNTLLYSGAGKGLRGQKKELRKIKRLLVGNIDIEDVPKLIALMRKSYEQNKLDITSRSVWRDIMSSADFTTHYGRRGEAQKLAEFGAMYKNFRENNNNGSYLHRVLQYLDDYVAANGTTLENFGQQVRQHVVKSNSKFFEDVETRTSSKEVVDRYGMSDKDMTHAQILAKNIETIENVQQQTYEFVKFLADYNLDGYVDYADGGQWMGNSLQRFYDTALHNIERNQKVSSEQASKLLVENILSVSGQVLENNELFQDAEGQSFVQLLKNGDFAQVLTILQSHPQYTRAFQNTLQNSPIQPDLMFVYGVDAVSVFEKTKQEAQKTEAMRSREDLTLEELEAIDNKADEFLGAQIDSQEERDALRPVLTTSMQNFVGSSGLRAGGALGTRMELIKNLHLNLAAGVRGENKIRPILGISLSYDKEFGESGISSHTALGATGIGFLPYVSQSIQKKFDIDPKTHALVGKSSSAKEVVLGVHGTAILLGGIPSYTLGVHAGFDRDKLKGIENNQEAIERDLGVVSEQLTNKILDELHDAGREEKLDAIKEILKAMGTGEEGKKSLRSTKETMLDEAAQTVLSGLSYFKNLSGDEKIAERKQVADVLTQFYALQWRNTQVDAMRGGLKGFDVGIDRIVGTTMFIPSLALTFEHFGSSFYRDSNISKEQYNNAENKGEGNVLYDNNQLDKQHAGDVDAMMLSQKEIEGLNRRLIEANPHIPQDLKIEVAGDSEPANKFLTIPAKLFQRYGVNVKISDDIKHLVYYDEQEGSDMLYVPRGVVYRLLDGTHTNNKSVVLNIGATDSRDSKNLIQAKSKSDFEGLGLGFKQDNASYESLLDYMNAAQAGVEATRVDKYAIEQALENIKTAMSTMDSKPENADRFIAALNDVRIQSYNADTKAVSYRVGDEEGSFSFARNVIINLEDDRISFAPSDQELEEGASPQFLYNYNEQYKVDLESERLDFGDLSFDESIQSSLSNLGHLEWKGDGKYYKDFMSSLVSRSDKDRVDVERAYSELVKLVESVSDQDYQGELSGIRQAFAKISEADPVQQQKMKTYLVHKLAVVMAASPHYKNKTIRTLLSGRHDLYRKMLQASGLGNYLGGFDHKWFSDNVYKNVDTTTTYDLENNRQSHKNIIGMAAFYRNDGLKDDEANGFALAPLGDVSVYGKSGAEMLVAPSETDKQQNIIAAVTTQLSRSQEYIGVVSNQLDEYLTKLGVTGLSVGDLSQQDFVDLLSGKEIFVGEHGVPLQLDVEAVAYGQAECGGNAGFGIRINKIKILGKEGVVDQDGHLSAEITQTGLVGAGMFYYNSFGNRSEAYKLSNHRTIGFAALLGKGKDSEGLPPPLDDDGTDPHIDDGLPPDDNDGTNPGV